MRSRPAQRLGQAAIGVLMLGFCVLIGRLIFISAHDGPRLLSQRDRQQYSDIPLRSRRGSITDARGRILAGTVVRRSVFADPKIIPDKEVAARQVAAILGMDPVEVGADLTAAGDRRFFVVRRGITDDQAARIQSSNIPGLGTFDEPARTYPVNGLASPVVGFVSPDGEGVSGLERQCNAWLGGENGMKTVIRDAARKAFWLADGGYRPARDGLHVVLTIDAEVQTIAERELQRGLDQFSAESGIAIVMQPKTGAILAMANLPGFDPNHYQDYSPDRYRDRAITDPFEPGSTFKPFIAVGCLTDGLGRLDEMIDCENGLWKVGPRLLHDHHPYGLLSFVDVIVKSSNIGMAKIGQRMGATSLYDWVHRFGFGEKTGIDLQGEDAGIVRPLKKWDGFSVTSIPMGQEIGVTGLQLARGFCAFANGGMLVQPHMIRAVLAADGRVVNDFSNPPPIGRALEPAMAELMKNRLLAEVVIRGSGVKAGLADYQVFGKTGTAQIPKHGGGGYIKNAYVASFVGGAPVRDPQLVVLVSIRHPEKSKGYYGGSVAAPVVREIMAHSLAYLQIPPEKPLGPHTTEMALGSFSD